MYPPNDWGCRCDVIPTDETPTKGYEMFKAPIKADFANNGAISGKIFKQTAYKTILSEKDRIKATQNAFIYGLQKADKSFKKHLERAIYELPRDWQFQEIYTNGKGKVLKHLLANEKAEDFKEVLESAILFADEDKVIEMLPVVNSKSVREYRKKVFPNFKLETNPDLKINKQYLDVKRISAIKNILGNANKASIYQNSIAVIYIKNNVSITDKILKNRATDIFKSKYYSFDIVYFVVGGKLIKFNRR